MKNQIKNINSNILIILLGLLLAQTIQAQTSTHKTPFDFDGDNKTDFTIWRPNAADWYILKSSNSNYEVKHFGIKTDKIVPGDYDGDGKTDVAVFRLETNTWYVLQSRDNAFVYVNFGTNGDVPIPADYDGDGKTDKAVFRPSESIWYVLQSSNGQTTNLTLAGSSNYYLGDSRTDVLVRGDFDGDGKADPAVWRPSTGVWYYQKSTNRQVFAVQFGLGSLGDTVGAGDYDNDGKTDIAVWRSSNGVWYVLKSSDGGVTTYQFGGGAHGDVPVPGDYDGDGKSDYAVWRAPTGTWYINKSQTNSLQVVQWGSQSAGDKLAPAAFIPTGAVVGNVSKSTNGTGISGALIEITQQGDFKGAVATNSLGNFSINGLLTGTYEARISAQDHKDARFEEISVVAGEATTNNVVLSPDQVNYYNDNFNDNNINSTSWVGGLLPLANNTAPEIQVAEANSQLEITIPASDQPGDRFNGLRTAQTKNFTDASIVVRVSEVPGGGVGDGNGKDFVKGRVEVGIDVQNQYRMEMR